MPLPAHLNDLVACFSCGQGYESSMFLGASHCVCSLRSCRHCCSCCQGMLKQCIQA